MLNDKKIANPKDIIAPIIATCAVMLLLSGCSVDSTRSSDSSVSNESSSEAVQQQETPACDHDRFYTLKSGIDTSWAIDGARIIVDDETGVEYLYIWNSGGQSGGSAMTMLVNSDGTPKINAAWALTHQDDAAESNGTVPSAEGNSE